MQQPLISVIIPVYNVEKYLMRCVGSILKQTYKNVEVILVNDGSTDSSPQICEHIVAMSDKVRIIHQENQGVSAARNAGLRASNGEYIHFCDADDFIEGDTYEAVMAEMLREEADAAYFGWSRDLRFSSTTQADNALRGAGSQFDLGYTMLIQCGVPGGKKGYGNYIWNKIFRKAALKDKENGEWILFDENVAIAEDGLWLVDVLPNLHKGVFLPKAYYHYVNNPQSAMGNRSRYTEVCLGSQRSHIRMLEKLKEFNVELYKVHQETCNRFFWMHVPTTGEVDEVLIEGTIQHLFQVNEGEFPPKLSHILKEYHLLREKNQMSREYWNRRSVQWMIRVGNLLRKVKRGIYR